MKTRRVGIIGAGPAGIMAALEAARCGARVLLLDSNSIVGRKILVTGNGRCNISNRHADEGIYACADRSFLSTAFEKCGHAESIARLAELGVPTYSTPDGWCYPLSESAAAVADVLAAQLELAGVDVQLQRKVEDITQRKGRFVLTTSGGSQTFGVDSVVVASGGKAYPSLGSTGELFPLLERMGHSVAPICPALAPLTASVKQFHKLQGVRLDVGAALFDDGRKLGETVGNLMFTQFGFSGPAAMDLSHLVSTRPHARLRLIIDLVPRHHDTLSALLSCYRMQLMPLGVLLEAVVPAKIPPVMLSLAGLPADVRVSAVQDAALDRLLRLMSHLEAEVTGTREFKFAQLSTGGIPVAEVEPQTMASRLIPGLHFAGEIMDVVGPCGGFNLQWAWTSGALAGVAAAS